jgi:hypothetical protein
MRFQSIPASHGYKYKMIHNNKQSNINIYNSSNNDLNFNNNEHINNNMNIHNYKPINIIIFLNIIIIMFILNINWISANFVCGQVINSDDNMSSYWYKVNIYYPENINNFSSCEISPAENKYCCDTEDILYRKWKIGDILGAEIFDNETGYFSGPVYVTTTGEGFNVFPEMKLEKAIKVFSPSSKLIFSNESNILLNAIFSIPFNRVYAEKENNKSKLCENCTNYSGYIDVNYGMNHIDIVSTDGKRNFEENLNFAVLNYFNYSRYFICPKCKGNKIKMDQEINVTLKINLSHNIENLELIEYVPISWNIIDPNGGEVKSYSETHNQIIWNVTGKNIFISYKVRAPKINFFPKKYFFRTELEDHILGENEAVVTNIFPFFIFDEYINFRKIKKITYSSISPERPLVIKPLDSEIKRVVIYPNKALKNVDFVLIKDYPDDEIDEALGYYMFYSDLKKEDISKILIELKIKKEMMQENNYDNITFYIFSDDNWEEINFELIEEDNQYVYYTAQLNPCYRFAIVGERNNNGILSFIGNLFQQKD